MSTKDEWQFSCTIDDFKEFKAVAGCMLKGTRNLYPSYMYPSYTYLYVDASESIMFASDRFVYRRSHIVAKRSVSLSRDAVRFIMSNKKPASVYMSEFGTVIKVVKGETEKEFETFAGHAPQIVLPSADFSATFTSVDRLMDAISVLCTQYALVNVSGIALKLSFIKGKCVVCFSYSGTESDARIILDCDTGFVGSIYFDAHRIMKLIKGLKGELTIKAYSNTDTIVLNDCAAIAPLTPIEESESLVKLTK